MTEANLLRWAATVAFVGCFAAGLYTLGVTAAPWVAFLVGALVFGVIMGRLWVTHLDRQEAQQARAEGGNVRRFQAREDVPQQQVFRSGESAAAPSAAASYYDDEDDD